VDFVRGEAVGTHGRSSGRANVAILAVSFGTVLALASGCSSHSHATPPPPSLLASSSAPTAAAQLASIAAVARSAQYTGTYSADSSDNPPRASTIVAYRTPTSTRLDVSETDGRVVIQVDPTGTYTCNMPTGGTPSCLTLAGPGDAVPANVNPSGQALFTTTLDTLAQGVDLTVSAEASRPAAGSIPASSCFALIAAPDGVSPGTYCFSAAGVLTRAQFRSNVLELTALAPAPVQSDFSLPASPSPVGSTAASSGPASSGGASGGGALNGTPASPAASS
jgi:hypothetical protein